MKVQSYFLISWWHVVTDVHDFVQHTRDASMSSNKSKENTDTMVWLHHILIVAINQRKKPGIQ